MIVKDTRLVVHLKKNVSETNRFYLLKVEDFINDNENIGDFFLVNIHGNYTDFEIHELNERRIGCINNKIYVGEDCLIPIFDGGGFGGYTPNYPSLIKFKDIGILENDFMDGRRVYFYNSKNEKELIQSLEYLPNKEKVYAIKTNSQLNTYLTEFGYLSS